MNAMSYVCVIFDILRMHYCNTECHIKPKGSNSEQNILNDLVLIFCVIFSLSLFFFLIKLLKPFAKSAHNPSREKTNVRHPCRRVPFTQSSFLHTSRVHLGLLNVTMEYWLLSHSSL